VDIYEALEERRKAGNVEPDHQFVGAPLNQGAGLRGGSGIRRARAKMEHNAEWLELRSSEIPAAGRFYLRFTLA
jgi:hypothetical protein